MTLAVNIAQGGSNNVTMRNRIINGAMVIDQRNAGSALTVNSGTDFFAVDRFTSVGTASAGVFTVQRSSTAPTGFINSLLATVTTADASPGTTNQYYSSQIIEGLNVTDLAWGTVSAAPITLSFWVRSSVTGTFGGAIRNSAADRSYAFTYTISSANTFEYKTVTIAGDTTGTWLTTNGIGMQITWQFGLGSTRVTTAGSWTAGNYKGASGVTNLMATNGATFYITGVQLEAGTTASPFEYRLYGTELALCQRYYWQAIKGNNQELTVGWYYSTTQISLVMNMPVPMRTGPTLSQVTGTDYYTIYSANTPDQFNSLTIENAGTTMVSLLNSTQVSGTAGYSGIVRATNASSYIGFTAEL